MSPFQVIVSLPFRGWDLGGAEANSSAPLILTLERSLE